MDMLEMALSLLIIALLILSPLLLPMVAVGIWFIVSLVLFIRAKLAAKKGVKKGNPTAFLVQMIIALALMIIFDVAVVVVAVLLESGVIPLM